MNFKIKNTRELKSLQLANKIQQLNSFFQDPNKCGLFITSTTLQPLTRIKTHEQFLANNLKITKLSYKLIKIIFKLNNKDNFKHLLSGAVYLIEDCKNSKELLSSNILQHILAYKNFTLRFIYVKQQLYRTEEVLSLLQKQDYSEINTLTTLKTKKILFL